MKRYIKHIVITALVGSFIGCSDLDEKPVGRLAPEGFITSPADVTTAVFGAYGHIATEYLWGRHYPLALLLRSDMATIGDPGTPAARHQVNNFSMDANNGMVSQFWPTWYRVISATNTAIGGGEQLSGDENLINAAVAEGRFVRAFAYYHLVMNFGDIPYIDQPVTDPESLTAIAKTPAATVFEKIKEDLVYAKQWLPDMQPNDIRSRPTKGSAAAHLAEVHLALGEYQEAYNEAKYVIDNKGKFNYGLEADFQNLFDATKQDFSVEPIFAIDFLGLQAAWPYNVDSHGNMTGIRGVDAGEELGWGVAVPTLEVYNSFDDQDYRKKVSFTTEAKVGGTVVPYTDFPFEKRPHIAKYRRLPGLHDANGGDTDNNYATMRYAEVLLIAAEAGAEIGKPEVEIAGYVNEVRARARNWAGTPSAYPADVPAGLPKDDFIDLVLEERRIELAFEFKRWFDIKRRNLGVEVFTGDNSLEPQANFNPARDYLMPLPSTELDVNPNLAPQNSGY